eukprot:CAMPEP_0183719362 /NCGR_PEP_ID=MMETSP0737-20130205/12339_1 /TAXON_ID=385413 /ORGANISM="Thalassiosira miniscula, Strain CCMP1093" /LENGTH=499 /DNA_ID=CAMNT_0025949079 /DNA_START=65 /DNA_END=1564 /DNA_ORIENTATION=+
MVLIHQSPAKISQRRGSAGTKTSASTVRRLLLVLFVALILPLVVLQKKILTNSINAATLSLSTSNNTLNGGSATTVTTSNNKPKATIAYAISLIRCSDFQSSTSGLLDAATILRHSVHKTSIRNPASGSRYDYKLYAIVHTKAASCSQILSDLGYEVLLRDSPVQISEIRGNYLRKNVHKEWCCGADEFVKLMAYTIEDHPIVVHTDIDFMYYQPMDTIFDAMLLPHNSEEGKLAQKNIEMEYPDKVIPENIQAYLTRDYHQVIPGRKAAFQAGFIVLKPNKDVYEEYLEIIREGNFVEGFSRENGWGGKGYGGVVGSMAMQGLPAYYYDIIRPNTTVELNGCRYNHMGANIFYEDVPNFIRRYKDLHGKCRRNVEGCEDCRKTDVSLVKNIHFTNCRKPWNCAGKSSTGKGDIDPRTADYDHCMGVVRKWHEVRTDLEGSIANITGDTKVLEGQSGEYNKDAFMGHCSEDGQKGYLPIVADKEVMAKVAQKIWSEHVG